MIQEIVKNKKAFVATTDLLNIPTDQEYPILLLKNPSASQLRAMITHFKFGTDSTSVRTILKAYSNPTITADGTLVTPSNTYIASGVPSSDMAVYKEPTVSANGTHLNVDLSPANAQARGVSRFYWIDPNNSILVTVKNSISNAKTFVDVYYVEGI